MEEERMQKMYEKNARMNQMKVDYQLHVQKQQVF